MLFFTLVQQELLILKLMRAKKVGLLLLGNMPVDLAFVVNIGWMIHSECGNLHFSSLVCCMFTFIHIYHIGNKILIETNVVRAFCKVMNLCR